MSTPDIAGFRTAFPEFETLSDDAEVQLWLDMALCLISDARFGCSYNLIVYLWIAHNLALGRLAATAPANTPGIGVQEGGVSAKTVGSVSVTYAATQYLVYDAKAGQYNATLYGRRFWQFIRLFGIGCRQL